MNPGKKVLFNLECTQPIGACKRHGGGKYGEIILRAMVERGLNPVCYYNSTKWLNPEMRKLIDEHGVILVDHSVISLEQIVVEHSIDVLYTCLGDNLFLKFKACPVLVTIHGLRYLETPLDNIYWLYNGYTWRNRLRFVIRKYLNLFDSKKRSLLQYYHDLADADNLRFVTVSHHTAQALKTRFPEFRNRNIPVFYSPSTSSPVAVTETKYIEKFFFMVSGNRWEKNNLRAIMALDYLFTHGFLSNFRVKIAGTESADIYRYEIQNLNRFDFVGYVDEEELNQLYHDAYAFVYPTLNEGFGYPPIEAMRYGTPVMAACNSSVPEVCQGAALYFQATDIHEIMNRMLLIADPVRHKRYSEKALAQYSYITNIQCNHLDQMINWIVGGGGN